MRFLYQNKIEERLEIFSFYKVKDYNILNINLLNKIFLEIFPYLGNYQVKKQVNILYLDIISVYRGWRHAHGLPTRGQRTWSNANTVKRSNLILRELKLKLAKNYYGNVSLNEINMAYLAESINSLWKTQWEKEWQTARKRLKKFQKYSSRIPMKIDLHGMSKGHVITGEEINKKKNKKKK